MAKEKEVSSEEVDGSRRPLSEEELEVAWSGPAVHSNRFYVNMGPTIRLSFCEQATPNARPLYRTGVVMSIQDAIALANLLKDMLREVEADIAKAVEEAEARGSSDDG